MVSASRFSYCRNGCGAGVYHKIDIGLPAEYWLKQFYRPVYVEERAC